MPSIIGAVARKRCGCNWNHIAQFTAAGRDSPGRLDEPAASHGHAARHGAGDGSLFAGAGALAARLGRAASWPEAALDRVLLAGQSGLSARPRALARRCPPPLAAR